MEFQVRPILEQMAELYQIPRGKQRFDHYLFLLQGETRGEMILPIAGYNPMGKDHVEQRLQELVNLNAERIMEDALRHINAEYSSFRPNAIFEVIINLSDDLGGAWTDRFASHYANTFDFGAITKRNFCTPYLWTSDVCYTEELIIRRMLEAVYRTIHFLQRGKPATLADHVSQETFVQRHINRDIKVDVVEDQEIRKFYEMNQGSEDYTLIFNFFYGDEASIQLGYQAFGNSTSAGFEWARYCAGEH